MLSAKKKIYLKCILLTSSIYIPYCLQRDYPPKCKGVSVLELWAQLTNAGFVRANTYDLKSGYFIQEGTIKAYESSAAPVLMVQGSTSHKGAA